MGARSRLAVFAHVRRQLIEDDLRNFLDTSSPLPSSDLAARNIQRGRDFGLLSYNDAREAYGLPRLATWSDVTSNAGVAASLTSLYATPDAADPWVAGLAEDHPTGWVLGRFFGTVLREQMTRTRDGDRYWCDSVSAHPLCLFTHYPPVLVSPQLTMAVLWTGTHAQV